MGDVGLHSTGEILRLKKDETTMVNEYPATEPATVFQNNTIREVRLSLLELTSRPQRPCLAAHRRLIFLGVMPGYALTR